MYTKVDTPPLYHPARPYFEPARLSTARLLKPARFWILLLVVSKKEVKSAEIAIKMLQHPRCCNPG